MKKQPLSKQIFSLFLALALVLGMVGAIPMPAKADEAAAEAKVLADELIGYNRITASDFESKSNERLGDNYTLGYAAKTYYVGNYNGKNYLDVDANFGELNQNHYLRYWGDADRTSIYYGSFMIRMLEIDGVLNVEFAYQDEATKTNTVVPTTRVVANEYCISGVSSDFNVKILTDISQNAEDASKETVNYQIWLNDQFVMEGSFVETARNRMGLCTQITSGKTVTVKNPAKPVDAKQALADYTRVTLEDYSCILDSTGNISLVNGANATYQGAADMDKTYIDIDVNYNGNVHYSNFRIRFFASDTWKDSYCLSWETASQLIITRYDNAQGHTILARVKNLSDFGISGPSDWFNVKYAIDFAPDENDATKQTAHIQLWLNNKLAWESEIEEVNAAANRNKYYVTSSGGTISARAPKVLADELKGYAPITLDEYDCNMNIRGEVAIANGGSINYMGNSFDKTYLDVDVNFNGVVGKGAANMRYQSSGKWTDSYVLGWNTDGTSLHLFRYTDTSQIVDFATSIPAADYGITSANDWFNVKIRTDITGEGTTQQTAHIQLWLNDKLAWEGDSEETRAAATRAAIFCSISGSKSVMLRSPRIIEDELAGYERVTLEDVNNLGAARTEAGTSYASGKSGEYVGSSFDKTYLDMDVQSTAGCFLTYLMSENTFWGNDRYQFELTGTTLKITQVNAGAVVTNVNLGLTSFGYTEGSMFNLKIRTDIEPSGNGQKVIMQFWGDDQYLAKLTFTEATVRTVKYMGIRGTGTGATVVRTPMVQVERADVAYDLSKGAYLLTGADYFYVNGKKMASGTILNTPNDYIIEQIIDGVAVAKQKVSLYYIGDVNLDGSAFVEGDPVWMDGHALQGIVNYGTPMRAAELAADINNDGKVTQADYDLMVQIRSDVSVAEEIVAKYYTDSLTYDYLGGKNVMPIGGFYGPYSDATLTDAMYKLIKDSGINLITYSGIDAASDANRLQQSLALAEKYGIGMFVTDSSLNTITKDDNGDVTANTTVISAEELAALMATYGTYDSFLGITIVDEPKGSANWENDTHDDPTLDTDFSDTNFKRYQYYEALAEALQPYGNITGYINLHGSQSVDTGDYYEYVSQIGEDVDVLSFDTYLYFEDQTYPILVRRRLSSYLESLDTIRQVGLEQGKPFWSYVQAGSDYRQNAEGNDTATEGYYTEADTLWIVNTSLAYGAKGIQYFPLLQPEYFGYDNTKEGGYDYDRNGLIGFNNEANRNYAMVQKANKQIAAIDDVLMNANSAGVIVTGTAASDVNLASTVRGHTFSGILNKNNNTYTAMLGNVSADTSAMVGVFDYQGYEAYYVVNYDRTEGASQNITLALNGNAKYRVIADAVTTSGEGNAIALTVPSGAGVLVVLETAHTHSYGDWTVTTPATLAAAGVKQQICACGDVIAEEIPCLANVESWNLTLGGDLSVNFVVDIHEDIADTAKIVITVAGVEHIYDAAEKVSVNVAAAQMNDEITVQIVNGDDASAVKTYTVLQYAQYVLADESLSNYHQLVKEMLNYGGFAQIYFEYNDENPVNTDLEGVGAEEVPADAAAEMEVSGKVDGISFYGASLLFRNKIAVRYYFTVSGDISSYTFTVNGTEYQPELKEEGLYYIEVADINPQDLDDAITVAVNETLTVSYSPMNYIVRMSAKGSDNLKALMKAIYNYHLAAEVICPDAQ